jgi:SpoVK/Ycf46/Vps4 family AAA+-type ATPase
MPEPVLRISGDLAFPLEAVTETFLIFAKRGVGKTYTASVLAEEFIGAGLPVCIVDPLGVWWGLRSSADGQGPGLPVTILGGEHADLPLAPEAGPPVADLLVGERIPVILDLSEMSKTQQRRFMTDFLERLYHQNREPLHVIIDEADLFAPQRTTGEIARLVGAYNDIARRGRAKGIGCTSITQRPAVLNADIRSQSEVLFAMRLTGKLDIAAIDDWIRAHADEDDARDLKASLPKLPVGTAWVWSPGWLDLLVKVQIRERRTFDSSATPKVGQQRIVPRDFARVDPADLERMAGLLGGLASTDPGTDPAAGAPLVAQLRGQVSDLRQQLDAALDRPAERVEIPVLTEQNTAALGEAMTGLQEVTRIIAAALAADRPARQPAVPVVPRPRPAVIDLPADESTSGASALKAGARNMLAVLARQHPVKVSRAQLATLARLKVSGGTFSTYFSALRRAGLITEDAGFVVLTDAGFAATGATPDTPIGAEELREVWRGALKAGARNMLDILLGYYPGAMARQALADTAGLEVTGGTFSTYLSTLRRNGLVTETSEGIRAADVFFLGATND